DKRNRRYYEVIEDGQTRKVERDRMLHVRGAVVPGVDRGLSPIGVERNVIGNALAGEKASSKVMKSGLISTTFLMADQVLQAPQRKQISETITQFAGAEKAGGVVVLEAGMTPHSLSINPKD